MRRTDRTLLAFARVVLNEMSRGVIVIRVDGAIGRRVSHFCPAGS